MLDPDIVERPLVIKTLEDNTEIPYKTNVIEHLPKGQLEFQKISVDVPETTMSPGKVTSTPISRQTRQDGNYQLPQVTLLHKSFKVKKPQT